MGNSGSSAEFENIGDGVAGYLIEEPGEAQQTVFGGTDLKFYKNGAPAMMAIVKLQTQDNNGEPDDDGIRILAVPDLSNKQQAIAQAVRAAGASDVEVGGYLTVTYTGDGVPKQKGNRPPKLYAAQYVPPQPKQSGIMAGGPEQQVVQQTPVYQQQQPPQQYAQQAPPPGFQPNPAQQAPPADPWGQQAPPVQQQLPVQQQPTQAPQQQQVVTLPNGQQIPVPPGSDPQAVLAAFSNLGAPPQQ